MSIERLDTQIKRVEAEKQQKKLKGVMFAVKGECNSLTYILVENPKPIKEPTK